MTREIWQFGDKYIDTNTGEVATPEEIEKFKERHELYKAQTEEYAKNNNEQDTKWHEQHDETIIKFFGLADLEDGPDAPDVSHWDDEHLVYQMATLMYDRLGYISYKDGQWAGDINHPETIKFKDEINKAFPNENYFEEAWQLFEEGYHDT